MTAVCFCLVPQTLLRLSTKRFPTLGDNDLFVTLWMKKVTLNASVYARLQKERSLSKTKIHRLMVTALVGLRTMSS